MFGFIGKKKHEAIVLETFKAAFREGKATARIHSIDALIDKQKAIMAALDSQKAIMATLTVECDALRHDAQKWRDHKDHQRDYDKNRRVRKSAKV